MANSDPRGMIGRIWRVPLIIVTELSLGFWKQEFKNPSLEKVGVKTGKLEFDQENLEF